LTETLFTDDTQDDFEDFEGLDDCDDPDPEEEKTLNTSANDTEPEPEADAEAESASMITATEPEPETDAAVGALVAGRSFPFFVTMTPVELCRLTATRLAASTFNQAISLVTPRAVAWTPQKGEWGY
ncbi:hypothetical protein PF008_g28465, partial [Phytophthora fragariae]